MGIVAAKDLLSSLDRAKKVGIVEDSFDLDGCPITLRNLLPTEYEKIAEECSELEDLAYVNNFQKAHLARALQEIDGVSFRDVTFIECDDPNAKKNGPPTIKREKHVWVRANIIDTWGKEAIDVAFRKLGDIISLAEKKSKKDVTFLTPDETGEEKFRRLLAEAKETQSDVPPALVLAILREYGYDFHTEEESREALSKLDRLYEEEPQGEAPPPPVQQDVAPRPVQTPPEAPPVGRRPLNEIPEEEVAPVIPVPPPRRPEVAPAPPPMAAPPPTPPMAPPSLAALSPRQQQYLANELEFNPGFQQELEQAAATPVVDPKTLSDAPVLEKSTVDIKSVIGQIDRPPTVGFNPKFRKPSGT